MWLTPRAESATAGPQEGVGTRGWVGTLPGQTTSYSVPRRVCTASRGMASVLLGTGSYRCTFRQRGLSPLPPHLWPIWALVSEWALIAATQVALCGCKKVRVSGLCVREQYAGFTETVSWEWVWHWNSLPFKVKTKPL